MTAELVIDARNAVGESPVWVPAEQALYWVDIPARAIHRCDAAGGGHVRWTLPEMVGCIAPHAAGGWVAAMESGIFAVDLGLDGPTATLLAAVDHPRTGMRFNDGRCDRQGRFRAGTMLMDIPAAQPVGTLFALEQHGSLRAIHSGLMTCNGLAFSPDGRTMYLSDSHPLVRRIWAFDYDVETGLPARQRLFVDMARHPGRPDGAAIDAEGCYWICAADAGLVHRFTPGGELDRSLPVPVKKPTMCAFGGTNLDTLYVTSIRPSGIDLADQPLAGGLFALRLGVGGLAEPACRH
ncbi:SMP-30/gluconolactonase/LRE family protein [Caenimonas sedimenti]|uniref:SMP-30/gluconolactonase/LRE family protein n=1 Tax=Caenimonas sedimenti TaxID=2596921 RepID=A0A562ZVG7_9BURK|nr:SMP-30/gluconolactonase/LRE family protein [Caenimonas sedimenti]TWO72570.1 SMP-30/gluconolactonase/LRE family protein [Caenimonas sedimenti]